MKFPKQKSKNVMLCHIRNLNEGVGDVKECHFINKRERKLRRAKFPSFLPDSCLQNCNCGPKSPQLHVQLVRAALAERGTSIRNPSGEQGNDELRHLANLSNRQTVTSGTWAKTSIHGAGSHYSLPS